MTCTLEDSYGLWDALRNLKAHLLGAPGANASVYLARAARCWQFHAMRPADGDLLLEVPIPQAPANAAATHHNATTWRSLGHDGSAVPAFLQLYLPIVLAAYRARQAGTVHVTGHLAQTLDGRIACQTGDSQWIGNPGNLRHAHRLRALHDAVLVGRHTVERDNPQLTVRHVRGDNPRRVVLNGSASCLRRARELAVFAGAGCLLVCNRRHVGAAPTATSEVLALDADHDGGVALPALLRALAARGLHSLFVEGGGRTLSGFLTQGHVDLLHLHIAPIILGSGVPGFVLPEVARLGDARRMHAQHFDIDGELLFTCRPKDAGVAVTRT